MCRTLFRCLALAAVVSVTDSRAFSQGARKQEENTRPTVPAELQIEIDRAIDRGAESLVRQQELDGSWRHDLAGYGPGATGLTVYTLLKCGLPADHLAVARGFEFMRRQAIVKTYTAATVMMAIGARGDERDEAWMAELLEKLLKWRTAGGWGYPDGRPDLSNTQFAGLGLRAAAHLGLKLKSRDLDNLADDALEYLEEKRGFSGNAAGFFYERGGERQPTGSMTCAGLTLVAIVLEQGPGRQRQALDRAQVRGLAWLQQHFAAEFNPMPDAQNGRAGWHLYYLYGIERVGSLFGVDRFGPHAWYEDGARLLVERQEKDGRWGNQADTCFALLFLARASGTPKATLSGGAAVRASAERGLFGVDDPKADVSLRASGTSELTFWVSSFGDRVRRSYSPDEEGKGPLPVKRVEYFIAEVPGDEPLTSFETVVADPSGTPQSARFAVRRALLGPATYEVIAEVTLTDFADGSEVVLRSSPLRVEAQLQQHPDLLGYAQDPGRNELASPDTVLDVRASSQAEGAGFAPRAACDGLQATAWRSAPADTAPWIQLEFERPARVGVLALTDAFDPTSLAPLPRTRRVRVVWNNDQEAATVVELVRDPRRKTLIDPPKGLRVRSLRLEIVGRSHGEGGVGFSEIEFLSRK